MFKIVCSLCGEEIVMNDDYDDFNEWFDEEGEEEVWGHLQFEHEEIFKEYQNLDTPDIIDEFFEIVEEPLELDTVINNYKSKPKLEYYKEQLQEYENEFIGLANEQTNYAFEEFMTFERAYKSMNAAGWGLPTEAQEIYDEIKRLKGKIIDVETLSKDKEIEW